MLNHSEPTSSVQQYQFHAPAVVPSPAISSFRQTLACAGTALLPLASQRACDQRVPRVLVACWTLVHPLLNPCLSLVPLLLEGLGVACAIPKPLHALPALLDAAFPITFKYTAKTAGGTGDDAADRRSGRRPTVELRSPVPAGATDVSARCTGTEILVLLGTRFE